MISLYKARKTLGTEVISTCPQLRGKSAQFPVGQGSEDILVDEVVMHLYHGAHVCFIWKVPDGSPCSKV